MVQLSKLMIEKVKLILRLGEIYGKVCSLHYSLSRHDLQRARCISGLTQNYDFQQSPNYLYRLFYFTLVGHHKDSNQLLKKVDKKTSQIIYIITISMCFYTVYALFE